MSCKHTIYHLISSLIFFFFCNSIVHLIVDSKSIELKFHGIHRISEQKFPSTGSDHNDIIWPWKTVGFYTYIKKIKLEDKTLGRIDTNSMIFWNKTEILLNNRINVQCFSSKLFQNNRIQYSSLSNLISSWWSNDKLLCPLVYKELWFTFFFGTSTQ